MTRDAASDTTSEWRKVLPLAPAPARALFATLGRVAPLLAGPLAAELFCRPHRRRRPPREQRWLDRARRTTLEFEGLRLPIWSWGAAGNPAVLLVHGWSGRGSQLGALAAPLVASGKRVVTCDLPAHGEATGRATHGVQLARAVRLVAETVGAEAVVAHSLGGIAAALAVNDGLALRSLVLLAVPADVDFVTEYFLAASGFGRALAPRVRRRIEKRVGRRYADLCCERLVPPIPPRLLIVQDAGDVHVPRAHVDRWLAAWPGARARITEHLGHFRILADGEVAARVGEEIAAATAVKSTTAG